MKNIIIDPGFRDLIQTQKEDEHKLLEESLLRYGCRDPLIMWGDILLDGHNRYELCMKHNIPFDTVQVEGIRDRNDAELWIIENQLARRNLDKFQCAELVLKKERIIAEKAKANKQIAMESARKNNPRNQKEQFLQKPETTVHRVHTDDTLARMAGVSRDTIQKTRAILKEGTEEQIERARTGGKGNTVNAVYNEVVGKTIGRRVCTQCGQEYSETAFLKNGTVCSKCRHTHNDAAAREIMGHIDTAVESLYDQDRVVVYTADDLELELNAMVSNFTSQVRRVFDIRRSVLEEPGAKQKMTAALSEAETAIVMLKELLT